MKGNGTPDNTDFADEKAIGVIREIRGSFFGRFGYVGGEISIEG